MNLLGPLRLTKALLGARSSLFRAGGAQGGAVIDISSDAAVNHYSGWGAYGASKAALRHLTAIWAEETKADPSRSFRSSLATCAAPCARRSGRQSGDLEAARGPFLIRAAVVEALPRRRKCRRSASPMRRSWAF